MPGKILFRYGRHKSRQPLSFSYRSDENSPLHRSITKELGVRPDRADYEHLLFAMHLAERQESDTQRVTRKDSVAQLKAMTKIKQDDHLITAIKHTDSATFRLISQAQSDLIAESISTKGKFTSTDGDEYRIFAPGLDESMPDYLPDGITGVRQAIANALNDCEETEQKAGRRKIESRRPLADEIWSLWVKYRPNESRKVWQREGVFSPALKFAIAVFKQIVDNADPYTVAELLKERAPKNRSN